MTEAVHIAHLQHGPHDRADAVLQDQQLIFQVAFMFHQRYQDAGIRPGRSSAILSKRRIQISCIEKIWLVIAALASASKDLMHRIDELAAIRRHRCDIVAAASDLLRRDPGRSCGNTAGSSRHSPAVSYYWQRSHPDHRAAHSEIARQFCRYSVRQFFASVSYKTGISFDSRSAQRYTKNKVPGSSL